MENEIFEALKPYIISLLIALIGYAVTEIRNRVLYNKLNKIHEMLEDEQNEFYTLCPMCGTKIILAKAKIWAQPKGTEEKINDHDRG